MRDARELAFVRVRQVLDEFRNGNPGHLGDLWILIIHDAVHKAQQVVVHRLVNADAIRDEPIIDHAEVSENLAGNTVAKLPNYLDPSAAEHALAAAEDLLKSGHSRPRGISSVELQQGEASKVAASPDQFELSATRDGTGNFWSI